MTPRVREQIKELKFYSRIMRKVLITKDGHWLWKGTKYSDKYGMYQYGITQQDNKRQPVHRVLWRRAHGFLPSNGMLVNRCGNTLCVNPEHWKWVDHWTHADDPRRGLA